MVMQNVGKDDQGQLIGEEGQVMEEL